MQEEMNANTQVQDAPETENQNSEQTQAQDEAAGKKREFVVVPVTDQHLTDSVKVLSEIIGYMGLNGEISARAGTGRVLLTVSSPDAGRIIGRKGQTLEFIQFLLVRILMKGVTDYPRISIDIDGYGQQRPQNNEKAESADSEKSAPRERRNDRRPPRHNNRQERFEEGRGDRRPNNRHSHEGISPEREETLTQQALDYAKEVMKWGEPITLPPMNSMERRIIHVALQEHPDIKTESIGDGARKSVVISHV